MTVPSDDECDLTTHLTQSDIATDDLQRPELVLFSIIQSKTDIFQKGISLYIGKISNDLCPCLVAALLGYLVVREQHPGSLFMFKDGHYLARQWLVTAVRVALNVAGLDQSQCCGHSSPDRGSYYGKGGWKTLRSRY